MLSNYQTINNTAFDLAIRLAAVDGAQKPHIFDNALKIAKFLNSLDHLITGTPEEQPPVEANEDTPEPEATPSAKTTRGTKK